MISEILSGKARIDFTDYGLVRENLVRMPFRAAPAGRSNQTGIVTDHPVPFDSR
jgi:hypothetical protein